MNIACLYDEQNARFIGVHINLQWQSFLVYTPAIVCFQNNTIRLKYPPESVAGIELDMEQKGTPLPCHSATEKWMSLPQWQLTFWANYMSLIDVRDREL